MASLARDRTIGAPNPAGSAGPAAISLALPFAALVVGACAMGASPVFVRIVSPEIGPFASAYWRVALALPFLYGWMRLETGSQASRDEPAAPVWAVAALSGIAFAGDLVFWHLAILHTSIANATFLATMAPVVVVAVTLALGRAVGRGTLGGLALCLAGGAALIGQSAAFSPERLAGDLYGIVTAVFFALYFLVIAQARGRLGPGRLSFLSSLVTAPILLLVALVFDGGHLWPQSLATAAALLGLAAVSQVGGQGLLVVALGRLPATFSSLVIFVEAMFAAGAGWLVLGERLTPLQGAGGALILFGIWVARPRGATAVSGR